MFPGRYRTALEPAMLITINDLVDLDCVAGYRCRGDIDVNTSQWVGFEFGNVHGSQLDIARIDKVYADDGKTAVAPPDDLAAWLAGRPGIKTLVGSTPAAVGGVAGTSLEIMAAQDTGFGPAGLAFGIPGGVPVRITVVKVAGHWVMVVEGYGPENGVRHFDVIVQGLQPVVDSITWE